MSIDATAKAAATGVSFTYEDTRVNKSTFLRQKIAVFAQGATVSNDDYTTEPWRATSAHEAGSRYGTGSPIHLIVDKLIPPSGRGVGSVEVTVYPLKDHESGDPAVGDITPSGTASEDAVLQLKIGDFLTSSFTVPAGAVTVADVIADMIDRVTALPKAPMIATNGTTELVLTAKWAGASGNNISVEVVGDTKGLVFAVTQPTGGTNNPDVSDAIALIGSRWESFVINAMEYTDDTTLDLFQAWGEEVWDPLESRIPVVVTGANEATAATIGAVTDARKTDRVNSIKNVEGSPTIPFVIAAAAVAQAAPEANNNPASDYGGLPLIGVSPGSTADQWKWTVRNAALLQGVATTEVIDNQVVIGDFVTCYHPTGEEPPAYDRVVNLVKLQNIAHAYRTEFQSRKWKGAILITDDDDSDNPRARRPKDVVAECYKLNGGLGQAAIIARVAETNANTTAVPDSQNPNRVNISTPPPLSGNMNITDARIRFGFVFGGQ